MIIRDPGWRGDVIITMDMCHFATPTSDRQHNILWFVLAFARSARTSRRRRRWRHGEKMHHRFSLFDYSSSRWHVATFSSSSFADGRHCEITRTIHIIFSPALRNPSARLYILQSLLQLLSIATTTHTHTHISTPRSLRSCILNRLSQHISSPLWSPTHSILSHNSLRSLQLIAKLRQKSWRRTLSNKLDPLHWWLDPSIWSTLPKATMLAHKLWPNHPTKRRVSQDEGVLSVQYITHVYHLGFNHLLSETMLADRICSVHSMYIDHHHS